MKRFLLILATLTALSAPVTAVNGTATAAQGVFPPCNGAAAGTDVCQDVKNQGANNGNNNPIVDIISAAVKILSYLIGVAAVIGIIVSSIRLMTAGGDSQTVASARSSLIYSLIGIAVAVLAQFLVAYVLDKV